MFLEHENFLLKIFSVRRRHDFQGSRNMISRSLMLIKKI